MASVSSDLAFGGGTDQGKGSYPPGPYGNTVGATVAPIVWQGYADNLADAVATTKPYGMYGTDDMFRSGRRYAMLHLSDFI
jgi:hypothetical protein